jgi:hypothetical protein
MEACVAFFLGMPGAVETSKPGRKFWGAGDVEKRANDKR